MTGAIAAHRARGGTVVLATFTNRHGRDDALRDLVERQLRAVRAFWNQRDVKGILGQLGCVGRVSAAEVTFGHASGWHPHRHVLLFIDGAADAALFLGDLCGAWQRCCRAAGLDCSSARGFDVRGGEAAGQYVVKLGLEVALAVRKKGRGADRFGMWQLLLEAEAGHGWASSAFVEYARAFKGRRHLVWSRGLRDGLGLGAEATEGEIMEAEGEADEALYARILRGTWAGICRAGIRGEVLQLLGLDEFEEASNLLLACGVEGSGMRRVWHSVEGCGMIEGECE